MAESLLAGDSLNDGGGAAAAKGGAGAGAGGAARITPSLAVCALLGSAGAAQYGLAVGVVNAPQASIKADLALSTLQISLVVSAFAVAGWAGATIAPRFVDSWGRRPFLIALQWIFVLGGGLCAAVAFLKDAAPQRSLAFGLLMAARCCFGAGAGAASVAVPMYLGEIAPASLKGAFGALNQFSLVVLILVGQFMSLGMSGSALWSWLFASQGVLAAAVILASGPLLLESPRWLVAQGRADEAKAVLLKCRGYSEADAEAEVDEILAGGAAGAKGAGGGGGSGGGGDDDKPLLMTTWQLLATRGLRAPLLVAVMLQLTQQFSGINAVFFYSTSFFEAAVADPHAAAGAAPSDHSQSVATWGTIATGFINVLATAASIPLIERAGRKPLLLWACGGMLACALSLTGVLVAKDALPAFANVFGALSIVFVLIYVCFFEVGLGAIPWSIGGELFPEDSRATAMGFAAGANWLGTTIVGVAFPYLQELLGNYSFLPFAAWLALGLAFTVAYVPETKGRTPAELLAWFASRSGAGGAGSRGVDYSLVKAAAEEDEA